MTNYKHSALLGALLPPGTALEPRPGTTLKALLAGMGAELDRVANQAELLVLESSPLTMSTMIDKRFAEADLQHRTCNNFTTSFSKKNMVLGQWAGRGGASPPYLTWLAGQYGYTIKIFEYPYWWIEQTPVETMGFDDAFATTFQVNFAYEPTDQFHPFLIEVTPVDTLGIGDGSYITEFNVDPIYKREIFLIEQSAVNTVGIYATNYIDEDYRIFEYQGQEAVGEFLPVQAIKCAMTQFTPAHCTIIFKEWPYLTNLSTIPFNYWQ